MYDFKMLSVILCLCCFVAARSASPISSHGYYPRSYIMGGSFYANPRYIRAGNPEFDYPTPGQMTAMVVGDTVATNSFAGTPALVPSGVMFPPFQAEVINHRNKEGVEEQTTEKQSSISEPDSVNETEPEDVVINEGEQETLFSIEEGTTETVTKAAPVTTTKAPRKIKVGKAKRPVAPRPAVPQPEEEDEDESPELAASWPFLGGKSGVPAYNAFFPIFINGGSPSGRSRNQDGNVPGSATAIANAFSTGKGGVATSHATAFGDPFAAAVLRNSGLFKVKTNSGRKLQPVAELED